MNPMQFLQIIQNNPMFNNPMIKNAMGMMNQGDTKGIQQMVENICRQKGISVDDLQKQVMRRFGM